MNLEGQQLGEFEILERLGQGGMGAVYKARQTKLRRLVALKTLQPSIAEDTEYIARFEQEAVAAAGLNHPNLVQVHSAGENNGLHWFAMEYVEGESAKGRLKRKGRLDPLEAIAITLHVATALEYGWRKATLIHRDIKPDNIFLSSDGEVKLGDLGLAKSAGQNQGLTATGHSMGTPHYISPEQVQSTRDVDLRADIYSLGCTLYHFLSGQAPFEGNSAIAIMVKHINEPVPVLAAAWPECPPLLNEIVGKMMQKDPAQRQQDYVEVMRDLRQAYEVVSNPEAPVKVVPAPTAQPPPTFAARPIPMAPTGDATPPAKVEAAATPKSKRPAYAAVAVVVLALIGAGVFIFKPKEKLTQAERRARDHAGENPGSGAGNAARPPRSASYPQPDQWIDLTSRFQAFYLKSDNIFVEGGWMRAKVNFFGSVTDSQEGALHNCALRVHFRDAILLALRRRISEPARRYELVISHDACSIHSPSASGPLTFILPHRDLPAPLGQGVEHEAVFAAQGDRLTFWLDGQEIASGQDTTLDAGTLAVALTHGDPSGDGSIRQIEYCELPEDKMTPGGATAVSSPAPALEPGAIRLWDSPGKLPADNTRVHWEDGAVRVEQTALPFAETPSRDAILRVSVQGVMTGAVFLTLRTQPHADGDDNYLMGIDGGLIYLQVMRGKVVKRLKSWPYPREYDGHEWVPIEFRVVGDELGVSVGETQLSKVTDTTLTAPGGAVIGTSRSAAFRDIVYVPLDKSPGSPFPKPEAAGNSTSASKDAPFINSLGMKFVPVPGTKVLFIIWDTRVQDYKAYSSANQVNDSWMSQQKDGIPVSRGPDYPVVGVSWDDAQAFNQWLTTKELAEAKIPKGSTYRLPTDGEWSQAAGLAEDAAETPADNDGLNQTDYPWGTGFPPSVPNVGNYADSAWHKAFPQEKWIEGYGDGFATTSPVGVFPANKHGLFDIGGNVWQWCEDWYDNKRNERVLRGASWASLGRGSLLSSVRLHAEPKQRYYYSGFRCVLELPQK